MLRKLNTKHAGFTLVEIMIVVAIIALLAAIAVPNFLRSRKRSQATQVLEDLRIIDAALDQYAIEYNRSGTSYATGGYNWQDVAKYVKQDTRLYTTLIAAGPGGQAFDILGNPFNSGPATIETPAGVLRLGVADATFAALSDVAPAAFWSPYK